MTDNLYSTHILCNFHSAVTVHVQLIGHFRFTVTAADGNFLSFIVYEPCARMHKQNSSLFNLVRVAARFSIFTQDLFCTYISSRIWRRLDDDLKANIRMESDEIGRTDMTDRTTGDWTITGNMQMAVTINIIKPLV